MSADEKDSAPSMITRIATAATWRMPIRAAVEDEQGQRDDERPHQRLRIDKGERGEGRDPGDAAENVQPVGVQRPEPDERPGDALADHRHDRGHGKEDDRQGHPRGQAVSWAIRAEEEELAAGPVAIWTGNLSTKKTSRASATGAQGKRFTRDRARRNPMPMPRKLPSRTKLEK